MVAPIWAASGLSDPPVTSGQVYLDACPPPYQTSDIADIPGVTPVQPVPFDGPDTPVPGWLLDLSRQALDHLPGLDATVDLIEALAD